METCGSDIKTVGGREFKFVTDGIAVTSGCCSRWVSALLEGKSSLAISGSRPTLCSMLQMRIGNVRLC